MSNRQSTGGPMDRGSKRWSVPKLEPIDLNSGPSSRPTPQQGRNTNRNSNRGSISGTAFGKSDFGVQLPAGLPKASSSSDRDRRASKRISRISKLSDVSEVESERARSRIMSGMPDDDGDFRNRRMSRKMSVADQLVEVDQRRMSRKMSMMSAQNLVVFGTKTSFMNRTLEWQQNPETLQKDVAWDDDLKKASNWTQQKKKLNTAVCCALAFVYTLTISVYSAAPSAQVGHLCTTPVVCMIPFSTYALGFALGPAIARPFEMAYGRKLVFFGMLPFYALLMIGSSVAKSIIALAVLRFVCAAIMAPGLWLTITIMSEIWIGTCETILVGVYTLFIVMGFVLGPVVSFVAVRFTSWRWGQYIPLFCIVILLFTAIGMSETEEEAIKRKDKTADELAIEAHKRAKARREKNLEAETGRLQWRKNLVFKRPLRMLLENKAIAMTSVYLAYTLALLITLPMISGPALGKIYHFALDTQGIAFIPVAGGAVVAFGVIKLLDVYVHQPRVKAWEEELDAAEAEKAAEPVGRPGHSHASWRRGLTGSRMTFTGMSGLGSLGGIRESVASVDTTVTRSNSDASSTPSASALTGAGLSNREKRKSRIQAFSERNINIAIAVTRFLNAQPENSEKKIIVERVMVLLKNTESFTVICTSLAELGLVFEEALLAKVVSDALAKEKSGGEIPLARSRSLHVLTAQAALMGNPDDGTNPESASASRQPSIIPMANPIAQENTGAPETPVGPPPEWRWIPALSASIIFPVGLLLFAWSARKDLIWVVPCVGLALAGLGACLIVISAYAYLFEIFWDQTEALFARAGSFILTFVFAAIVPLVASPLQQYLGVDITLTILAGVAAIMGAVPWVLCYKGANMRPEPYISKEDVQTAPNIQVVVVQTGEKS